MNREQLKSYLLRDKGFLKQLHQGNPLEGKKLLQNAEDSELNTLIKFLHFLSNGEIKMKKENSEKVKESNKLKLLTKEVEKKSKVSNILKSPRKDKLKFLNKLLNIYPNLLDCLFTEI